MPNDSSMNIVKRSLLDLLRALEGKDMPLILCGGFGLYVKQLNLQERNENYQPLLSGDLWPRPRATEDIDVLVRTEVLADPNRCLLFRETLDALGYKVVTGAEYMQFSRKMVNGLEVKLDLLTGPVDESYAELVTIGDRRIKPANESVGLHAHRTDEAIGFQENLQTIEISGLCSGELEYRGTVYIPSSLTFSMMKLFAFRDRRNDKEKGLASHHALDIYRIIAMMDHEDFQRTRSMICDCLDKEVVQEAKQIVTEYFSTATSLGILRMQEHNLFEEDMKVDELIRALHDLFEAPNTDH